MGGGEAVGRAAEAERAAGGSAAGSPSRHPAQQASALGAEQTYVGANNLAASAWTREQPQPYSETCGAEGTAEAALGKSSRRAAAGNGIGSERPPATSGHGIWLVHRLDRCAVSASERLVPLVSAAVGGKEPPRRRSCWHNAWN